MYEFKPSSLGVELLYLATIIITSITYVLLHKIQKKYDNYCLKFWLRSYGLFGSSILFIYLGTFSSLSFMPVSTILIYASQVVMAMLIVTSSRVFHILFAKPQSRRISLLFYALMGVSQVAIICTYALPDHLRLMIYLIYPICFFIMHSYCITKLILSLPTMSSTTTKTMLQQTLFLKCLFFLGFIFDFYRIWRLLHDVSSSTLPLFMPIYLLLWGMGALKQALDYLFKNDVFPVYIPLSSTLQTFQFTPREEEVLDLALNGLSNQDIASKLYISHATVKRHILNIYKKMSINSRAELFKKVYT